jgi:F0F1-type ATP synthase epsilon subunit
LLKGHEDYVAPIVVGALKFDTAEGEKRLGCAAYGFVNLMDGSATVFTTTFEFVEEIDVPRAKENMERTRIIIAEGAIGDELIDAKARYDRCKARLAVAQLGRGK